MVAGTNPSGVFFSLYHSIEIEPVGYGTVITLFQVPPDPKY